MTSRRASSRLILGYIVTSAIPMEVADVFFVRSFVGCADFVNLSN